MKKPTKKFIFVQILISALIFLPGFYIVLTDWYLSKHLASPCTIDNILSRTCSYDTSFAELLNKIRNFTFPNDSFMRSFQRSWGDFIDVLYDTPLAITTFIFGRESNLNEIFGFILIPFFWLAIINSVYFLIKKVGKYCIKK